MNEENHIEKREHERKKMNRYLEVFENDSDKLFGHLVNITPKGMQLLLNQKLSPKTPIKVKLLLPPGVRDEKYFHLTGTTVWTKEDSIPDHYRSGFLLNDVSPEDIQIILIFISLLDANEQS